MTLLQHIGNYILTYKGMFTRPENPKMYWKEFMHQCVEVGIGAMPIVVIISLFLGMVMVVQTAYQLVSNLIPRETIAVVVRDSMLLELSPTVMSVVLAGVIGSKISSELGNMRISEQIDALEIMGINTKLYLILPKILACLLMIPMLVAISLVVSLWGGRLVSEFGGIMDAETYDRGLRSGFQAFNVLVAFVKAVTFAFILSSVSAYFGYNVKGGALEIGRSSTRSVVVSCILILLADYILTLIMLNT